MSVVDWELAIFPEDRLKVEPIWAQAVKRREMFETECRIVLPNGTLRLVHCIGKPVIDQSGKPIKIVGTIHDVTEVRSIQNKIKEQEAHLIYSSKMSNLGEMAGGIAHEINNPLAIIRISAGIVAKLAAKPEVDLKMIIEQSATIMRTVDRIADIIRGLRAFARDGERDAKERVSARKIIDDALMFCRARYQNQNVVVQWERPADGEVDLLYCRPVQISQVMMNLLNNAFDAVCNIPLGTVVIKLERRSENLAIVVSDNGPGVPEGLEERIFEPFFTTKSIGQGTGLGLSISSSIVKAHGGQLRYQRLNPGASFVMELPRTGEKQIDKAA